MKQKSITFVKYDMIKKFFVFVFLLSISFTQDKLILQQADLLQSSVVNNETITQLSGNIIFKKNDIEVINCIDKKFDPNFHQAMLEIEDNTKEAGTVIQEIQKGFMMKDRLLRPSFVGVTKKRDENVENSKKDEKKTEEKEKKI